MHVPPWVLAALATTGITLCGLCVLAVALVLCLSRSSGAVGSLDEILDALTQGPAPAAGRGPVRVVKGLAVIAGSAAAGAATLRLASLTGAAAPAATIAVLLSAAFVAASGGIPGCRRRAACGRR